MKTRRAYTMTARARSVEETRRRILEVAAGLATDRRIGAISLDDVATGAGVSVQTVLRQFGSKAGLVDATTTYVERAIVEERAAPVGDVDAAVRVLVDHYEARGELALLLLAQELDDPQVRAITDRGKGLHRAWVEEAFAPHVGGDDQLVDLLVVVTDVYAWKLLRLDRKLSRARTEQRMTTLVRAVLATTEGGITS